MLCSASHLKWLWSVCLASVAAPSPPTISVKCHWDQGGVCWTFTWSLSSCTASFLYLHAQVGFFNSANPANVSRMSNVGCKREPHLTFNRVFRYSTDWRPESSRELRHILKREHISQPQGVMVAMICSPSRVSSDVWPIMKRTFDWTELWPVGWFDSTALTAGESQEVFWVLMHKPSSGCPLQLIRWDPSPSWWIFCNTHSWWAFRQIMNHFRSLCWCWNRCAIDIHHH